jgi:hypothetical protein
LCFQLASLACCTRYGKLRFPPYLGLLLGTVGVFQEPAKAGVLSWFDLIWPAIYTWVYAAVWWLNEVHSVGRLREERAKLLSMTDESVSIPD